MKTTLFLFLTLFSMASHAQTVFSESFDEADDATTGSDAIGPATWSTAAPGSVAATDYFKVVGGVLEARDTNSPGASWTTGDIDISSCTGLDISFSLSESGTMEGCADCGGTGTICIDWVKLEYNLDGGGWTEVAGVTCALAESPGEMIQIGEIGGGGPITITSPCIDFGSTLQLRISCMCWAGTEYWRFDDILVECNDCVLPVDLVDYHAQQTSTAMQINWSTLTERSNDYFMLERSYDAVNYETVKTVKGAGNSTSKIDYQVIDTEFEPGKIIYYRISQYDFDNKSNYTEIISVESEPILNVYYGNNQIHYALNKKGPEPLNIYDLNGQLLLQKTVEGSGSIPWTKSGFYIIEIPRLNLHQKLMTQ
jgi:hypothetical protein